MLQAQPLTTGREIARRLEIDARTVRRYVAALQALDIPVEGQRGVGGGYRVRPGYRLPPLMLSDDEAVAVVLGLIGARGLRSSGCRTRGRRAGQDPAGAAYPAAHTGRGAGAGAGFTAAPSGAPVAGAVALARADAIRRRRRVRFAYRSFSGEPSRREVSPYGLVVHAGRWYLAAHDHGREDLRTFRVDRATGVAVAREAARPPDDGFDAVAHVSLSLARVPWTWEVEVLLHFTLEEAAERLPRTLAELAPAGDRTMLRMRVDSLDWMAGVLAGLGCDFEICAPAELGASVRALADRLSACA